MKMTLVLPSYGGGVNVERTINSCRHVCDERVIISTALFEEDRLHFQRIADQVVQLPWNYVFLNGHGELHNQGTEVARNDWLLLLGTAETWAEGYGDTAKALTEAENNTVFRCDHHGDPHSWKRIWNRQSGARWSGIMHEEIGGGGLERILFRMQDTEKVPGLDPFKDAARKWIKACSYNWLYLQLLEHPERLGAANRGWLSFVKGAEGSIRQYCSDNGPMIQACVNGNLSDFLKFVEWREQNSFTPYGVKFEPVAYENQINQ